MALHQAGLHVAGAHLLIGEKKTHRYTGLIPKISPWAILTLVRANRRIDKLARTVPVEAPWTAERADELRPGAPR